MAGKADVERHLGDRSSAIEQALRQWADPHLKPSARTELVEQYFAGAELGDISRPAGSNSIIVKPPDLDGHRATILVVGSHDLNGLGSSGAEHQVTETHLLGGPGVGSTFGPMLAFAEGVQAARSLLDASPVNVSFLSIGHGDRFDTVASSLFTANLDAVFLTNSICWNPYHPTITTGARGQVVVELSLRSGQAANDFAIAGAVRNPLNKLTEILGALRDERGRIAVPDFYARAQTPDPGMRDVFGADDHDPDGWAKALHAARPTGRLSALERAALWPVVSVLDVSTDRHDGISMPGTAAAVVAFYLVPDQRHVEVEAALRTWFQDMAPADLHPSVHLLSASRPYRADADSAAVAAQARAAFRIHGRRPILVPGGGPAGAGEIAFSTGAPVAFAGICGPQHGYGSIESVLPRGLVEQGISAAAQTCLELRRT